MQRSLVDDREHVGYLLAAPCGLRRGDVCGPRWPDLALTPAAGTRHLRVRQQLVVDDKASFTVPKTAASRCLVALDEHTARLLDRHRQAQRQERSALGLAHQDHDLIVCHADGTPVNATDRVAGSSRRTRLPGLPHLRLHDLRRRWCDRRTWIVIEDDGLHSSACTCGAVTGWQG